LRYKQLTQFAYPDEANRKLKGVRATFREAVDAIRPYSGGNDLLFGLHKLDLRDKHQLLTTPVISVAKVGTKISAEFVEREFRGFLRFSSPEAVPRQTVWIDLPTQPEFPLALEQGAPVLVVAGDRETHRDIEVTFDIGLAAPDVFRNRSAMHTLGDLAVEVERVLAVLEAALE
jgi:hypothetical protein